MLKQCKNFKCIQHLKLWNLPTIQFHKIKKNKIVTGEYDITSVPKLQLTTTDLTRGNS